MKLSRKKLLEALAGCGAYNDRMTFTRLYAENRISRAAADEAWKRGASLRKFCEQRDAEKIKLSTLLQHFPARLPLSQTR